MKSRISEDTMQYNGPLDQPSNPNAPYIDGNPAAGIEGSIVPAAMCEFPQREIVEVINQANLRGYTDFTGTACPSPSNADLTELRKAIEGFITDWQFLITTNVTFTVHGPGANFPDLITAFAYLSKYKITTTGHVTLQLGGSSTGIAAKYTYNQPIVVDHPNNDRISLLGAPMLGSLVPNDSGYAWNGSSQAQRTIDTSTNLATLRGKFATELFFPGSTITGTPTASGAVGAGFIIRGNMLADFDGILITSDGAGLACGVMFMCHGFFNSSTTRPMMGLAVVGFSYHGFNWDTGSAISNYAVGSNASPVANATWLAIGNGQAGMCLGNGSFHCTCHNLICLSNAAHGFLAYPRAGCQIDAALFTNANAQEGVIAFDAANVYLGAGQWGGPTYTSHCYRNGGWGLYAFQANINFSGDLGASGYNNVAGNCYAMDNSSIALSGSTNIGVCSPAYNAIGNNNSMISA
jgi:hypothetical protein